MPPVNRVTTEIVAKEVNSACAALHDALLLQFLGPAELAMPACERAAVASHRHIPTGFPQPPLCFRWSSRRSVAQGALEGLQDGCRGGCRCGAHPFPSDHVACIGVAAPIQHAQRRLAGRRDHQPVWCNSTLCAATFRAAQQHDMVRERRRSSVAHRPQPNGRPETNERHRAPVHVVQHAAHPHVHAHGTLEISYPRPVPRFLRCEER